MDETEHARRNEVLAVRTATARIKCARGDGSREAEVRKDAFFASGRVCARATQTCVAGVPDLDAAGEYLEMDSLSRVLILIFVLFGFVSFSAAIGAEFRGSAGLPKWARSCVLPGRAATTLGRLGRTLVFFVLAAFSPVLILAGLADSLRYGDVLSLLASIAVLVAAVAWLAFFVRWLHRSP